MYQAIKKQVSQSLRTVSNKLLITHLRANSSSVEMCRMEPELFAEPKAPSLCLTLLPSLSSALSPPTGHSHTPCISTRSCSCVLHTRCLGCVSLLSSTQKSLALSPVLLPTSCPSHRSNQVDGGTLSMYLTTHSIISGGGFLCAFISSLVHSSFFYFFSVKCLSYNYHHKWEGKIEILQMLLILCLPSTPLPPTPPSHCHTVESPGQKPSLWGFTFRAEWEFRICSVLIVCQMDKRMNKCIAYKGQHLNWLLKMWICPQYHLLKVGSKSY